VGDVFGHFWPGAATVKSWQGFSPVQLGNQGGLITLLNPDGLKVDGVAYTQAQAAAEGWSIVF
jgi:hypothetical protein